MSGASQESWGAQQRFLIAVCEERDIPPFCPLEVIGTGVNFDTGSPQRVQLLVDVPGITGNNPQGPVVFSTANGLLQDVPGTVTYDAPLVSRVDAVASGYPAVYYVADASGGVDDAILTEDNSDVFSDNAFMAIGTIDDEPDKPLLMFLPTCLCPYFWEFEVSGGNPSSGSQVWDITLDSDQQDVTVTYAMTAAELKSELLSEFSGLTTADLDVTGGPLPELPLTIEWKRAYAGHASSAWDDGLVVVGTNTLNNDGWMKVREINPRPSSGT